MDDYWVGFWIYVALATFTWPRPRKIEFSDMSHQQWLITSLFMALWMGLAWPISFFILFLLWGGSLRKDKDNKSP